MGFYIQPTTLHMPLWDWLMENGHPISYGELERFVYERDPISTLPVCWIDNGQFQAAGIAFDYEELIRFLGGMGDRPHQWFLLPKDTLKPWLPERPRQ